MTTAAGLFIQWAILYTITFILAYNGEGEK